MGAAGLLGESGPKTARASARERENTHAHRRESYQLQRAETKRQL